MSLLASTETNTTKKCLFRLCSGAWISCLRARAGVGITRQLPLLNYKSVPLGFTAQPGSETAWEITQKNARKRQHLGQSYCPTPPFTKQVTTNHKVRLARAESSSVLSQRLSSPRWHKLRDNYTALTRLACW